MARLKVKVSVDFDNVTAILDEIKALPTYSDPAAADLILVNRAQVGEILAKHVKADRVK